MTANRLSDYQNTLYGCRFCPMCKPAGEVANVTQYESHTTRARAMMLWRIIKDMTGWTPRGVELLYQSTLDSISEAWCVSHYSVSGYVLAARAEVYSAGMAPDPVQAAVRSVTMSAAPIKAQNLLLAGEFAELGQTERLKSGLQVLKAAGTTAEPAVMPSGALAYSLGAHGEAREQAQAVVDLIRTSGIQKVIADGPQTLWALEKVYTSLGVDLPEGVIVTSLLAQLAEAAEAGCLSLPVYPEISVFVHDSRSAALLADTLAKAETIQPGYRGDEENLGSGTIYDITRTLVDMMQMRRVYSVWQRSLSRTSGADDGLWRTYPRLAEALARQRLAEAQQRGAQMVVTDSPLSAEYLGRFSADYGLAAYWLPDLMAGGKQ